MRITEVDQFVQQLIADHKVVSDTLLFDLIKFESKEMQTYEKLDITSLKYSCMTAQILCRRVNNMAILLFFLVVATTYKLLCLM